MPVRFPRSDADRIANLVEILKISPPNNNKTPLVPLEQDVVTRVQKIHDLFTSTLQRNEARKREINDKSKLLKSRIPTIAKIVQSYWDTVKLYLENLPEGVLPGVDLYQYYHIQPKPARQLPPRVLLKTASQLLTAIQEAEGNQVPVFQTIQVDRLAVSLNGLEPMAEEVETYRKYRPTRTAKLEDLRKETQRVLSKVAGIIRLHCAEDKPNILREKMRSFGFTYLVPGQDDDVVDTNDDGTDVSAETPDQTTSSGNIEGSPVAPEAIASIG